MKKFSQYLTPKTPTKELSLTEKVWQDAKQKTEERERLLEEQRLREQAEQEERERNSVVLKIKAINEIVEERVDETPINEQEIIEPQPLVEEYVAPVVEQIVVQGERGEKGEKGDKGDKGEPGQDGKDGQDGGRGDVGPRGDKGDKGDTGEKGDKGDKGEPGKDGTNGTDGRDGVKGDKGDRGEKGDKGDSGLDGKNGTDGKDGAKGDKGDRGEKGDKGDKGEPGRDGKDGAKGDKGDVGPKGDKGDRGEKGDKGADGKTPDIKPFFDKFNKLSQDINTKLGRYVGDIGALSGGGGSGSYWLNDLGDTDYSSIINATDGQVLTFDAASKKWFAADAASSGGGTTDAYARLRANAAFTQANTGVTLAQSAYDYANTIVFIDQYARDVANTASANTIAIQGVNTTQNTNIQSSWNQANSATVLAQAAYDYANTIVSDTQIDPFARTQANAAFDQANSSNVLAQAAFDYANTIPTSFTTDRIINGSNNANLDANGVFNLPPVLVGENDLSSWINPGNALRIKTGTSVWRFYESSPGYYGLQFPDSSYQTTAFTGSAVDQTARDTAGFAFDQANSATVLAQSAYDFANTSNIKVDSAYAWANTINIKTDAAFTQANTATTTGQSAFDKANAANVIAQSSYDFANSVNTYAYSAYAFSNTVNTFAYSTNSLATTANTTATDALSLATSANSYAYSTNVIAVAAQSLASTANTKAQAAFDYANTSITTSGGSISGRLNVTYQPATTVNTAVTIAAANTLGGTGYADIFKLTNSSAGATNPNKYFRINNIGTLEIINSAYTSNPLALSDTGDLSVSGNVTSSGVKSGYSSARPGFRVYGSGTTNNLGTTVNTHGALTGNNFAVDFNQGTYLNTTSGVFTAPVAGLYQVNLVARNAGNAAYSQLAIVKNATGGNGGGGSVSIMIEFGGNSTMNHTGGSTVLQLASGDTLACKVLAGTINFDSNDNWSLAYIG